MALETAELAPVEPRLGGVALDVARAIDRLAGRGVPIGDVHGALAEIAAAGRVALEPGVDVTGLCPRAPDGRAYVAARAVPR